MSVFHTRDIPRETRWTPRAPEGEVRGLSDTGSDPEEVVRRLDQYLRGEISAIESFDTVLETLTGRLDNPSQASPDPDEIEVIRRIRQDHAHQAARLRERIHALEGAPSDDSGVWGLWARTVMSTATLFGPTAQYKALKEGEEYGLSQYRQTLADLDEQSLVLVNEMLIPATIEHIDALAGLIARVDHDRQTNGSSQ